MCPFEEPDDLNQRRAELILLWHEERRLRKLADDNALELETLRKQLEKAKAQIDKLKADAQGGSGKTKKNRSERRRTGHNNRPKKDKDEQDKEGHGPKEQPDLEQQDLPPFELDEADKVCTACGGALEEWEGHEDKTVLIEVIERRFVQQNITQKKYRCRCGNCLDTAPGPERVLAGGRYSISFAIEVAHDKYMLHLPLERQAREMGRQGLDVDSQTLWDQVWALSRWLRPAYDAIHRHVLGGPWVAADETTWWMMRNKFSAPETKPGEWYAWIAHVENAAFYLIGPSRDDKAAKQLLSLPLLGSDGEPLPDAKGAPERKPFEGKVLCDGWWAYKYFARHHPNVVLVHCWSHARREFFDCQKSFPKEMGEVLDLIADLFLIEREAPKGRAGDEKRAELRRTKSAEVLEKIGGWVYRNGLQFPAESNARKAVQYLVNHWVGLTRFVDDPTLPLDNNDTEKDCRQAVQGKKNHYGSRSERGAEAASIHYTIVQSAKLSGIEPKTYMRLAALRAMRGRSVVLPHEVTEELLGEELGLTEAEAKRVLARRRAREGPERSHEETGPPQSAAEVLP